MRAAVRGAPQHKEPPLPPPRVSRNANTAHKNRLAMRKLAARARLPDAAVRLARAVAVDSQNIDRTFCQDIQARGVSEGAYVEIVALVSRLSNLDVFTRGLGIPAPKTTGARR